MCCVCIYIIRTYYTQISSTNKGVEMNDIDDLIVEYSPANRCPFFQVV